MEVLINAIYVYVQHLSIQHCIPVFAIDYSVQGYHDALLNYFNILNFNVELRV